MRDVQAGSPLLDVIYRDLLVPTFPTDELGSLDGLRAGVAVGSAVVSALLDEADQPAGVAVGEWSAQCRVLLLAYLAVAADRRAAGLGGRLLGEVTGAWQERFQPRLTLAELEHPAAHASHEVRGDPAARLRFYARYGVRALDLPYFQPALHAGAGRVYGLVLAVIAQDATGAGRHPGTIDPAPVRSFLTGYFVDTEGAVAADPAGRALWRALDRPDGIPLLSLDDPAALPLSHP